jgi:hypothetical protein
MQKGYCNSAISGENHILWFGELGFFLGLYNEWIRNFS